MIRNVLSMVQDVDFCVYIMDFGDNFISPSIEGMLQTVKILIQIQHDFGMGFSAPDEKV